MFLQYSCIRYLLPSDLGGRAFLPKYRLIFNVLLNHLSRLRVDSEYYVRCKLGRNRFSGLDDTYIKTFLNLFLHSGDPKVETSNKSSKYMFYADVRLANSKTNYNKILHSSIYHILDLNNS